MSRRQPSCCLTASIFATCCLINFATASPITCKDFRTRLATAISEAGDKVAQPDLSQAAYRADETGFARYKLTNVSGMTGYLGCNRGDAFYYFEAYVDLDRSEEGALRLLRLENLAAAGSCAISPTATPKKCAQRARKLVQKSVKAFSSARVRGEVEPSGISDEEFANAGRLEIYADPGRLSFRLGAPKR